MKGQTTVNDRTDKRALSIAEAARYACVSRGTIENWLAQKLLPCEELPSRGTGAYRFRRIRKKDLDSFLNTFYHETEKSRSSRTTDTDTFLLPRTS